MTIQGVTIQNGSAPAGGAIRVPSPTDLTLQNDFVQDSTAGAGGGGGVFMLDGDLTSRERRSRTTTSAGAGGGVLHVGNGALTINNSLIEAISLRERLARAAACVTTVPAMSRFSSANSPATPLWADGGGFLNTNNAALTISSSTFNNNRSNGDGGGLFLATGVASSLTNITISNNVAQGNGGGLDDRGTKGGVITLQNDTIAFNSAELPAASSTARPPFGSSTPSSRRT